MTPGERSIRGRIGAYTLHAQGKTNTGPARAAAKERFEKEVDPDGILPAAERQRRAKAMEKAHMSRIALKSSQKRRLKKPQNPDCS